MPMHPVLAQIAEKGVVAILRGVDPALLLPLGQALADAGVGAVEVTLNSEGALEGITALNKLLGNKLPVGAGTVLTADAAREAIAAGAQFLLTPHLMEEVLSVAVELEVPAVIGAMTPSEIYRAHALGAEMVKVFPAGTLGPQYFRDLRGPLPQIPTMAVGGINVENAGDFIRAGAKAVGAGGQLVDMKAVRAGDWEAVRRRAAAMVEAVQQARAR